MPKGDNAGARMETSAYHDEIWRQLPADRTLPHWRARREFCLALVRAGQRVLDLGCGDGPMLAQIASAGARPVGADVSQVALERAAGRGDFELRLIGPDGRAPFADETFDGVWASEVLGQALDPGMLLAEARRVLRPQGWIGITTLRPHSRRGLRDQLRDHDFERIQIRGAGGVPGFRALLLASAVRGATES